MKTPRLMLFDVTSGGHHGMFVQHLVEAWVARGETEQLVLVVPPDFLDVHRDLQRVIGEIAPERVSVVPIDRPLPDPGSGVGDLVRFDFGQGDIARDYIDRLKPDHCLCMHFDHVQLWLAFGARPIHPASISGIYFRPTFHYEKWPGHAPSWKQKLNNARKRFTLKRALRHPLFNTLFSLDPFVVPDLQRWGTPASIVALPDGITPHTALEDHPPPHILQEIEPDRKVALLFGALSSRKGIFSTLEALRRLPAPLQSRLAVVFAGAVEPSERGAFLAAALGVRQETRLQVLIDDRFLPDADIQSLLHASDLVLVTYQQHVGSSNVVIRAAAAGKPVIGPTYGLLGQQIRTHHLGATVDTQSPDALMRALERYLETGAVPFDAAKAAAFAQENTAEAFASTILDRLV
ncbi:MAG: glycosyltransferase family 4 protein [Rhodothermales bacterium]